MSKYGDDIRRIARYKDKKETDTIDDQKTEIPGKRGVAIEQSGNITSFKSSPGSIGTTNY